MSSSHNAQFNKKSNLFGLIIIGLIALGAAFASSSNNVRRLLNQTDESTQERLILAKVFTTYNNTSYVIFKIRTEHGVDVEIYEKDNVAFTQKLKQNFSFPDDKNAFLMINENSVTLGLSDIDKDGIDEIIVPTVDQYGLSRLNIFKYDSDLNQFSQTIAD